MAIDGKNVATLHWPDMLRLLKLKPETTTFEQGTALFTEQYPQTQVCSPQNGTPYALVRVHTVILISSEAAVCVHQRSTLGHTNEIGSMPEILDELKAAYGRSKLFSLVTTDAGNTSCGVAGKMVEQGIEYFAQIKSVHGEIHAEALDMLSHRRKSRAHTSASAAQNGLVVSYHLWRYDLTDAGWLDWTHARQLVRIQRTAVNQSTGEVAYGQSLLRHEQIGRRAGTE